jgi:hypothetical protein
MTAIVTTPLKTEFIQQFFDDLSDSATNYYVGIGRSQDWNDSDVAPTPKNTGREERDFRLNMQSMKLAADWSFVVPRNNWSTGTVYSAYSDVVAGHGATPYYVITENNAVYICLRQGRDVTTGTANQSSVEPTGVDTTPQVYADGYVWKFLYTIGASSASKFLSANFMPVQFVDSTDSSSLAVTIEQKGIQDAADSGQLAGISVLNSGAGYVSQPTVTITGNGTLGAANAVIVGGAVSYIEIDDSGSILSGIGSGYDYAAVSITGGSPTTAATARAQLGPRDGFGRDPRIDLRARAIMINVKPDGEEGGEFVVDNFFRQIGLIKNPYLTDSASDGPIATIAAGNTLQQIKLASVSGTSFSGQIGETITSATASAIIDKYDSDGGVDYIWFHQTDSTGFGVFATGQAVTAGTASGITDGTTAVVAGKIDPFSGDLLYIDNRAKIERDAASTEDLKIVIEI